ncbi:MAG: hypothetical protein H6492_01095 [Candidatus Paracaedibacteraceae bacterium]|nr:hypothetical protein [Candidatus Paracaedibacteraceae bacterium]
MAFISLIGPILKEYLSAKIRSCASGERYGGQRVFVFVLWVVFICGVIFALSSLYEHYTIVYTPVQAKAYMSVTFLVLASGGGLIHLISKGIRGLVRRKKANIPAEVLLIEQYAKDALAAIETEGVNLIKQHPFAAALIGISVGLLSGATYSKHK